MADATWDDVQRLLQLQETTAGIRRLRHRLDNLDEQQQLLDAEAKLNDLRDQAGAVRLEIQRVQATIRKHEKEIGVLKTRLEHEQEKLYGGGVTNARELKSVEAEIKAIQTRVDENENAELEGMMKLEELEGQLATLAEEDRVQSEIVDKVEDRRDEAAKELLVEIAEGESVEISQRAEIPRDVLETFDKVARREPRPVAQLKDGSCTACGITLPSIEVNELRAGPTLGTCPCPKEIIMVVDHGV